MAVSSQGDLFRGLRFFTEASGNLRLEGTVELAAKYTGLSTKQIHDYIEAGEILARAPGSNQMRAQGATDKLGRRLGYKKFLNMRDVFRIAYGEEEAARLCEQLGVPEKN